MRFLHIINVRWYNASAWYAVNLCRLLKESNHEVLVAGITSSPPIIKSKHYGIDTVEASFSSKNLLKIFKTIYKIEKILKTFKPDVINCHRGEYFWYFAVRRFFLPSNKWKLIRFRGDIRDPKNDILNRFLHKRCADLIIATGKFIKDKFVNNLNIPDKKIDVLYGGVDTGEFYFDKDGRNRVRKEFEYSEDHFVVGIVGRFDPIKGHDDLIKALSNLYHKLNRRYVRLLIIGYNSVITSENIRKLVKAENIESICTIVGHRKDIRACISAFDLAVISSIGSEAISRTAFEIMASGIPLVASDTGVLPEIVVSGNIFHKRDIQELSDKIINHSKNVCTYSDEAFLEQYLKYVEKLLNL